MSLVNDALRKARLEAERQQAKQAGAILPTLGQVRSDQEPVIFAPKNLILYALGAVAILVIMYVAMFRSPDAQPEITQATSAVPHISQSPTADPSTTDIQTTSSEPVATETSREIPAPQDPQPTVPIREPARQSVSSPVDQRADVRPSIGTETATTPAPSQASKGRLVATTNDPEPPRTETVVPAQERLAQRPSESVSQQRPMSPSSAAGIPTGDDQVLDTSASGTRESETLDPGESPGEDRGVTEPIASDPAAEDQTATDSATDQPAAGTESFRREASIPGVGVFRLDGIAWSSDRPFALINGEVIGPGGFVDGATVAEVGPDRVVLERDNRRFEITLR